MTRRSYRGVLLAFIGAVCLIAVGATGVVAAHETDEPEFGEEDDFEEEDHPVEEFIPEPPVHECAAEAPEDHEDPEGDTEDVIGWVDGYWYDEPLEFEDPSALSDEELDSLTARTAARVEAFRCLTFEEVPPVEMLTREEFGDRLDDDLDAFYTEEREQAVDAQLATMLVADQETEGSELMREHQTGFAAAFYDPVEESIGFVGESPEDTEINQVTFAHELLHALQDQHYDLEAYNQGETTDQVNANLSVVEGEAWLIEHQYEYNCLNDEWADDCIGIGEEEEPPEPVSWQLALQDIQPYTDGFTFAATQYAADGWDGIDQLFEQPPTSTLHSIYPDKYGGVELEELTVPDESSDDWDRISFEGESNADRIGQSGLSAMLVGPSLEMPFDEPIVDPMAIEGDHPRDNLNFDHPETDGWRGDQLYTYQNDDETGAVWKLSWTDSDEAERFAGAYGDLIKLRGGDQHDDLENVYTFEEVPEWEMAAAVEVRDDRLWIVTAPTVDELTEVHEDLELDAETDETDDEAEDDVADDTADDDATGFGPLVALAGLLGALLIFRRGSAEN